MRAPRLLGARGERFLSAGAFGPLQAPRFLAAQGKRFLGAGVFSSCGLRVSGRPGWAFCRCWSLSPHAGSASSGRSGRAFSRRCGSACSASSGRSGITFSKRWGSWPLRAPWAWGERFQGAVAFGPRPLGFRGERFLSAGAFAALGSWRGKLFRVLPHSERSLGAPDGRWGTEGGEGWARSTGTCFCAWWLCVGGWAGTMIQLHNNYITIT